MHVLQEEIISKICETFHKTTTKKTVKLRMTVLKTILLVAFELLTSIIILSLFIRWNDLSHANILKFYLLCSRYNYFFSSKEEIFLFCFMFFVQCAIEENEEMRKLINVVHERIT